MMLNMDFAPAAPSVMFVLLVAVPTFSVLWRLFFHTSPYPLPPRPRGEPVLGHIRLVPTENPHLYYQKLAEEYGECMVAKSRDVGCAEIQPQTQTYCISNSF